MKTRSRFDQAGTSLVEMIIVIVLGGLITAAAVSSIGPTNQLARAATEATQLEDGARSTVHLLAGELRRVSAGGVLIATTDSVVVAIPVAVGAVCANSGNTVTVYLGLGGAALNTSSVDGYATRSSTGVWTYTDYVGSSLFSGATQGRSPCTANGGGAAGSSTDYYTFTANMPMLQPGVGVLVWDRQSFRFGTSLLDPTTRGFHTASTATNSVEVAYALHPQSRFLYRLRNQLTWLPAVGSNAVADIDAIRVVTGPADQAAPDLVRDVPLMNTE